MSACAVPCPSGGTYPSVPTNDSCPIAETSPMSATFGTPPTKMMFAGLMSRCTSPCRCSAASAAASEMPSVMTSSAGRRATRLSSLLSVFG